MKCLNSLIGGTRGDICGRCGDKCGTYGDIFGTCGDLVVVQLITLSLPTRVEVELGCDKSKKL